ncbi:MAG: VanW family protein [Firmicutes bacterium]|nr:VanW family protein [Bacillota bacterium]
MPPIRRTVRKAPHKTIIALFCVLLILGSALAAYSEVFADKKIKSGVTICGIDVGKMTVQKAHDEISQRITDAMGDMQLLVKHRKLSHAIEMADNMTIDVEASIDKAYAVGREGGFAKRLISPFTKRQDILLEPKLNTEFFKAELLDFAAQVEKGNKIIEVDIENKIAKVDLLQKATLVGVEETYQKILSNAEKMVFDDVDTIILENATARYLYERINKQPKDAQLEVVDNRQIVHEHTVGVFVDYDDIARKIEEGEKSFQIDIGVFQPEVTTEKLKSIIFADTLGEFTTQYSAGNITRSKNISIAAGKIHGKVIAAGQNFSFNDIVGARTYANGYMDANVYVGGKIEQGVGGGICQVSSTIYSAQLYADLQTVSRSNHMFTVSYLPLGQDATVVWNSIDYIFKNNTGYPIKMFATANNGVLTVKIMGTKTDEHKKIKIVNTVISSTPQKDKIEFIAGLAPGQRKVEQQGQKGAVVDTYKIYTRNGAEEKRVFLHRSTYLPMDRIIYEGEPLKTQSGHVQPQEDLQTEQPASNPQQPEQDIDNEVTQQHEPVPTIPDELLSEDGL